MVSELTEYIGIKFIKYFCCMNNHGLVLCIINFIHQTFIKISMSNI